MMSTAAVPPGAAVLQPWIDAGVLGPAEVHTAGVIAELVTAEPGAGDVALAVALAVWAPQHGHSCIDLATIPDIVHGVLAVSAADGGADVPVIAAALPWPEPEQWLASLRASAAVREVTAPDDRDCLDEHPLVLHGHRVYTQRQWADECSVAAALRRRARRSVAATLSTAVLDALLPPDVDGVVNQQRVAAGTAATSLLMVLAGGPGTGKTHTVASLLAAELSAGSAVRIGVAAPTGKAANRLREAFAATACGGLADGVLDAGAAAALAALPAVTVHRLLGPRPDHRTRFEHDAADPLPFDLIVVDETSMLALPLTARLLAAVADDCRLVLVGDPDQLTSIEVGAVLGDVVDAANTPGSPLGAQVVRLTRQHRTGAGSPIGPLAEAIRRGDADAALAVLRCGDDRLRFVEAPDGELTASAVAAVLDTVGPAFRAGREAASVGDRAAAFEHTARARILCGHRRGRFGVESWNELVERHVRGDTDGRRGLAGRVLLATRNDPRSGLVNGDHGVMVRSGTSNRAVFSRGGELVAFDLAELDSVETAYAMTVHKSQGSEYDRLALVHPPSDSPLVTRELLYTAATRAKSQLVVVASVASIRRAVTTPTRRVTGLTDALR